MAKTLISRHITTKWYPTLRWSQYTNSTANGREVKCWLLNLSRSSAYHKIEMEGKMDTSNEQTEIKRKRKMSAKFCFLSIKERLLHQTMTRYEKWISLKNLKMQKIMDWPKITNIYDKIIIFERCQFCVFGGIKRMCTMSFWNQAKQYHILPSANNLFKSNQNGLKDMEK